MLHLTVVCADEALPSVLDALAGRPGVVAITQGSSSNGRLVTAKVARESAEHLLDHLHGSGALADGMATLDPVETAIGPLADRAEREAPGEGVDAIIWDELVARTGEDSTLTWTFLGFMTLATILASIGVVTDSQVTVVGAMVVGPEFGPLAGLAVGLVRRRASVARRASIALLVGFAVAILVTLVLAVLARTAGLISPADLSGHRETEFIYHPGWFSLITALVAGTAGMLSLTSSKSAALVGVFISVTTVPAAGNAAVAGVLGNWNEAGMSVLQLGINVAGIVAAGAVTLLLRRPSRR